MAKCVHRVPLTQQCVDCYKEMNPDPQRVDVERLTELLTESNNLPWRDVPARPGYITTIIDNYGAGVAYTTAAGGRRGIEGQNEDAELIVAAVNALPALLQQLADYQMAASAEAQLADERGDTITQLRAKLAERDAEIERLDTECKDRIRQALENGQAFHAAELDRDEAMLILREVEKETEASEIAEGVHPLNDSLRNRIAAFLAGSG